MMGWGVGDGLVGGWVGDGLVGGWSGKVDFKKKSR